MHPSTFFGSGENFSPSAATRSAVTPSLKFQLNQSHQSSSISSFPPTRHSSSPSTRHSSSPSTRHSSSPALRSRACAGCKERRLKQHNQKPVKTVRPVKPAFMAPGLVDFRESPELNLQNVNPNVSIQTQLKISPLKTKHSEPANPSQADYIRSAEYIKSSDVEYIKSSDVADRFGALKALVKNAVGGCAVLDGGLATELEARGADINDPLWSAKCLLEDDLADLVRQVHFDYYKAGADVSISASYQAAIQGFVARGFSAEHAEELLARSVRLVVEARDQFWEDCQRQSVISNAPGAAAGQLLPHDGKRIRQRPLVAASVGSYGAYLADGSEYSGEYGPDMTLEKLAEFHRRRVQVLASAGPDILAFETIPSLLEAQALVKILEEENLGIPAWISFNSKDGVNVVRGDLFEDCALAAHNCRHVVAVGINCTPPRLIKDLLLAMRKVTDKTLVVYPNSGETWDGIRKEWVESSGVSDDDFVSFAPQWVAAGASLMGGCCRTSPHTISSIRKAIEGSFAKHGEAGQHGHHGQCC